MDDPFLASIDAFIARAKSRADLVSRAIAEGCLARVKELTPVRTGNLRANWLIVQGNDPASIAGSRADGSLAALLQIHAGVAWSLVNPVSYAARIEFGFVGQDSLGRSYDQTGAHMLQQTITELPQIADEAIKRVKTVVV